MSESQRLTTEQFIQKAKVVHGDEYDYSLVDYKHSQKKVKIICKKHGIFEQNANSHLQGKKCHKCFLDKISTLYTETTQSFIKKAIKLHGERYNYSNVKYLRNNIKVIINCHKHGNFIQTPQHHLNGSGCPKCKSSSGELKIEQYLKECNINFITQKKFPNCKDKRPLPFDFYLPDFNTLIEYDGPGHFKPVQWHGISKLKAKQIFSNVMKRDKIKNGYCLNNNIHLIRISFKEDINKKLNLIK